eukprot:COSAG02_NODE_43358_length_375_cov_1.307971_1_plen_70_part_01
MLELLELLLLLLLAAGAVLAEGGEPSEPADAGGEQPGLPYDGPQVRFSGATAAGDDRVGCSHCFETRCAV